MNEKKAYKTKGSLTNTFTIVNKDNTKFSKHNCHIRTIAYDQSCQIQNRTAKIISRLGKIMH